MPWHGWICGENDTNLGWTFDRDDDDDGHVDVDVDDDVDDDDVDDDVEGSDQV